MSSEASLPVHSPTATGSLGSRAVEAHIDNSMTSAGIEYPAPQRHEPRALCPPQLSEEAIASIPLQLPPLDQSRMSPAVVSAAELLSMEYAITSSQARSSLLAMREAWMRWNQLPVAPPGNRIVPFRLSVSSRILKLQCRSMISSVCFLGLTPSSPGPSFTEPIAALYPQPTSITFASNTTPIVLPLPATTTDTPTDYAKHIALSAKRCDDAAMKVVFERHKDDAGGLSKAAFIAALKEVQAPVLFSSDSTSEDALFARADTNASGCVDLSEYAALPFLFVTCQAFAVISVVRRFMLAANLPDDLEMLLEDHRLSFAAAALRAHAPSGSDQLRGLASLTTDQLDAAVASSTASLMEQLHKVQQLMQEISQAQDTLQQQRSNTKYQIRKMDVGSTDDFHKGLADRIGKRPIVAQCVHLLTVGFCRVAQSGLRKEHAGGALQLGRVRLQAVCRQLRHHLDALTRMALCCRR